MVSKRPKSRRLSVPTQGFTPRNGEYYFSIDNKEGPDEARVRA